VDRANKEGGMISFTILGQCASKSNSRRLVYKNNKPMFIKSKRAMEFKRMFMAQVPKAEPIMEDVVLTCTIYYSSRRPDLDESLVMDCLEGAGIIGNDRQIKEKHIYWGLDKKNPRVDITVERI